MTLATGFFIVGVAGQELVSAERRILRDHPPGGILLFARNIAEERQLRALVAELRSLVPDVLIFVDQEGGSVDRFRALLGETPSFAAATASGTVRRAGELAGEICAFAGVDVDLAPVVDRAVPLAGAAVLSGRCAGPDGQAVGRAAGEFIEGLADFGVASCLKHFPGLGRARVDSHLALPTIEVDEREDADDILPFRILRDRAPAVMISHAAARGSEVPATLDPAIATTLLRGDVGFRGLAISDDLEMGALARAGDLAARSALAFSAGCDLLCISSKLDEFPGCAEAIAPAVLGARGPEAGGRVKSLRRSCIDLRGQARRHPKTLGEMTPAAAALVERAARGLSA